MLTGCNTIYRNDFLLCLYYDALSFSLCGRNETDITSMWACSMWIVEWGGNFTGSFRYLLGLLLEAFFFQKRFPPNEKTATYESSHST